VVEAELGSAVEELSEPQWIPARDQDRTYPF
jgi:hypothetical protein